MGPPPGVLDVSVTVCVIVTVAVTVAVMLAVKERVTVDVEIDKSSLLTSMVEWEVVVVDDAVVEDGGAVPSDGVGRQVWTRRP